MAETPISEPVRPKSILRVRGQLWTCSPTGSRIEDITRYVLGGTVSINWQNEIKGSLKVTLRRDAPVHAIVDCLMPIMELQWRDGSGVRHRIEEPMGVFYHLPPDETISETDTIRSIDGMDGLWRLSQLTSEKLQWYGTGKDYGEAAYEMLVGMSPVPLNIPRAAAGIVTPITVRPNDYLLKSANNAIMAGDHWDFSVNRSGTLSTTKRTVLGQSEPARRITNLDVIGEILRKPLREEFCNQVFLSSNNPEAELTLRDGYKVSFVDPDSPFNIYDAPIVSKSISDSRDESFQTMRNRAISILEAAAGMQRRITVPVFPDPRFDPREAWELRIEQRDGFVIADGMFRVEQMDFGFTPDSMAQLVTLSELVNIQHIVEGTV